MEECAVVEFNNLKNDLKVDLEIPLTITANDLIIALNDTYSLGMNIDNIFECFLISENPICLLKGNKQLKEFGIRNGSKIIFREERG